MAERRSVSAIIARCSVLLGIITLLNFSLTLWWKGRHNVMISLDTKFVLAARNNDHFTVDLSNRDIKHIESLVSISHGLYQNSSIHSTNLQLQKNTHQHSHRITVGCNNTSSRTPSSSSNISSPSSFLPKRPFSRLTKEDIDGVRNFVFFVGYARSGHSIVASMMDAHPNMIIAHEYRLFHQLSKSKSVTATTNRTDLYNLLYWNSYSNAVNGWRSAAKTQKGYTLAVNNGWQGAFSTLQVIGDKSGGATTQVFKNDPSLFLSTLERLRETVNVPIRVIHVMRNPYDMISTRLLYSDASLLKIKSKLAATETNKYSNITGLGSQINRTFHIMETVQGIFDSSNLTVLDVHLVDFIKDTRQVLKMICTFLGVECPREYIESCVCKVYKEQSKTRRLVEWPEEMREDVELRSKPYPFLWRYSFDGD